MSFFKSSRLLMAVLVFYLITNTQAWTQTLKWSPLKEPGSGGRIDSIAISPHNSNLVLAGGDILGTRRSSDRGKKWSATVGWLNYEISDFTWHPKHQNIVWSGTLSGPHLSTDGGRTWVAKRRGLPAIESSKYSAPVEKILFDPNSKNILAFGGDHRQLKSNDSVLNYGAVWWSNDSGANWARRSTIVDGGNVMDASYAGTTHWTIYAIVWKHGFFRSGNNGWRWTPCNRGLPRTTSGKILVSSLAVHPLKSEVAWVTVQDAGIYKTTNGGNTWRAVNSGLPTSRTKFWSIAVAKDGTTLYAGNREYRNQPGVYKSTDSGKSWTRVFSNSNQIESQDKPYPGGINPGWVEIDPNNKNVVYIGTDNGVFRSTNGGTTWSDLTAEHTASGWLGTGLSGLVARNIEWNPDQSNHLVLQGMDAAKAIQSWDGGNNWRVINPGLPKYSGGHDVAFAPGWVFGVFGQSGDDTKIIARSSDRGRNWTVLSSPVSPSEAKHLHVDPKHPNRLWVVVNQQLWYTKNAIKSTNPLWVRLQVGSSGNHVGDIEADLRDGDTFYIATDDGIYRTTDGRNFKLIGGPNSADNVELNLSRSHPNILYATSDKSYWNDYGVWRYSQSNNAWNRIWDNREITFNIGDLAVHPKNPNRLALITNDQPYHDKTWATGVWTSDDAGQTWHQQNDGLPMLRGAAIAFSPDGSKLVVGLGGAGFYVTDLDP